ncbi:toprim domain-containing protein [Draconibacterium sp.]|nr:toprim domain-containing protein [Draconibacterium sp.]
MTQGHKPAKIYGKNWWYKAPYREDRNPSFKINTHKNTWYDLSISQGGTLVDLVMLMFSTDIPGALATLERNECCNVSFSFSEKQKDGSIGIEIKHVQPLQTMALTQYLLYERKIPVDIASKYVSEAYYYAYKSQTRAYYAVIFKNDKGGYELRNGYKTVKFPNGFKGATNPKSITTLPGNDEIINVFEGFINFLSALRHFKTSTQLNKTIILNSTTNLHQAEKIIKTADKVVTFLDNDKSGFTALEKIRELNPNVVNQAERIYPEYNDFNDFICNNHKS